MLFDRETTERLMDELKASADDLLPTILASVDIDWIVANDISEKDKYASCAVAGFYSGVRFALENLGDSDKE